MEPSEKRHLHQGESSPARTVRSLPQDVTPNQESFAPLSPDRLFNTLQAYPRERTAIPVHDIAFNRDILNGNEGKISHDSGVSQSTAQSTGSGATTPTSMNSVDTSSDLFHATTLKVHGRDAEALQKARQTFSATNPSFDKKAERSDADALGITAAVPAPLSTPIPLSAPSGPVYQSRMPVALALRPSIASSGRDMPSQQSSPLRQSTTFQQEQLASLNISREKKDPVEELLSPMQGQTVIPRSNSLPAGVIRASAARLPPSPGRYADANEYMPQGIEEAAFSIGRPPAGGLPQPPILPRTSSVTESLTEASSVGSRKGYEERKSLNLLL